MFRGKKREEDQGQGSGKHPKRAATKDTGWTAGELGGNNIKLGWAESNLCCHVYKGRRERTEYHNYEILLLNSFFKICKHS